MTSVLHAVSGREAIRVFGQLDYGMVRRRGSHIRLHHAADLAMLETMPAATLPRPETTPRQPSTERKTPRQVRDLPRGIDLPACLTGQCANQAAPRPRFDLPKGCARKVMSVSDSRRACSGKSRHEPLPFSGRQHGVALAAQVLRQVALHLRRGLVRHGAQVGVQLRHETNAVAPHQRYAPDAALVVLEALLGIEPREPDVHGGLPRVTVGIARWTLPNPRTASSSKTT